MLHLPRRRQGAHGRDGGKGIHSCLHRTNMPTQTIPQPYNTSSEPHEIYHENIFLLNPRPPLVSVIVLTPVLQGMYGEVTSTNQKGLSGLSREARI